MNRRDREWKRETKNKKKNIQLSFTIISYFVIYLVMPIAPKYSKKYICFTFKWCLFVNRLRNYTTRKTKDSNSQGKRENCFDETEKLKKMRRQFECAYNWFIENGFLHLNSLIQSGFVPCMSNVIYLNCQCKKVLREWLWDSKSTGQKNSSTWIWVISHWQIRLKIFRHSRNIQRMK